MAVISPFSGSTDLGKLIKGSTVKMSIDDASVWTGIAIGSKYNRTLVLTIAHEIMRAEEWMTEAEIQQKIRVQFLGDPISYPCRVLRYLRTSNMLLVAVDGKSTEFKLKFPTKLENKELLSESELLGSRGHPKDGQEWTFIESSVASPNLVNNEPHVMEMFEKDMLFFEHRSDMRIGYSGAPLVNIGGFLVGMQIGGVVDTHYVVGTAPLQRAARIEVEKNARRNVLERILRKKEIDEDTISNAAMTYGRPDTRVIRVPKAGIKFAIHAEYMEKMLRSGEQNVSLEDMYLAAANVAGPSTRQLA